MIALLRRLSPVGLIVAFTFFSVSLTPSLVPRPAVFLGLLSGLWAVIGYGLGAALQRWVTRSPDHRHPRRSRQMIVGWTERVRTSLPTPSRLMSGVAIVVVSVAYAVLYGALVVRWQNDVRALVEMEPMETTAVLAFVATVVLGVALGSGVGLGLRTLRRLIRGALERRGMGFAALASMAGTVAVAVIVLGIILALGMRAVDGIYSDLNDQVPDDAVVPSNAQRSAGPGSAVKWDGLGRHGRAFIGGGPTAERIEEVTGATAMDPVRVYVGMGNADTLAERARIAVDELERTGGFERSVLVVATPTGSGWLEAQAVDSVEFLHGGDTAIVSIQYSFLPSWASFLFDEELPVEASRELFNAVHAKWETLPPGARPTLAVYGLSLGATGMQAALGDLDDIREKTDAALFVGAPNGSQPWRELQAARDSGSPEWLPVLDGGAQVRWLSKPGDFDRLPGEWEQPRVAYLQHATDAVTWMDLRVIWQRPDWLSGPAAEGGRGADVSDAMVWFPGVTYLHLVADMIMGLAVPAGHGHNFGDVMVDGWEGVLPRPDRDEAAAARIQEVIEAYSRDVGDPVWE